MRHEAKRGRESLRKIETERTNSFSLTNEYNFYYKLLCMSVVLH